jgi:ubiquinone/menaquinone biosynthesis C-methylase UbiE
MGISVQKLNECLDEIERIPSKAWMDSLDDRKRKELEFHDMHRDLTKKKELASDTFEKLYGNEKYYNTTRRSTDYVDSWLKKHVPGKIFLDYACGDGMYAIAAAKAGAAFSVGIDISKISVDNATAFAAKAGVSDRCRFVQADCEDTHLPGDCIDVVLCSGMLHHLDLSFAFPELRRIMAPGGVLLAVEALDYNPAIKLYRKLTPAMRTEWEAAHILSLKDVRFGERFFERGDVRYWHLTSPVAANLPALLPLCNAVDGLLTKVPLMQLMAWIFTFELWKKADPATKAAAA